MEVIIYLAVGAVVVFGLIDQLGKPISTPDGQWYVSERGNQTIVVDGVRYTVFASDGGWKFSQSRDGEDDPYFSPRYDSVDDCYDEISDAAGCGRPTVC